MRVIAAPAFKNRERNPYNWLLYSNMEAEVTEFSYRNPPDTSHDVLHLHWPERELNNSPNCFVAYVQLWVKLFVLRRWRAKGTKIVWTVHNLRSHNRKFPRVERWFWPRFTAILDGVIALSSHGLEAARREHPATARIPGFVVPHGHYRGAYPEHPGPARARLGIEPDAKVLLFFGQIRGYKDLPGLIRAFRSLSRTDLVLCVAGEPSNRKMAEEVRAAAASDPRIRTWLYHISDAEVQPLFRSADLVVLPYREILNSGAALLALSFNRPVLVPHKGAMQELAHATGDPWVRTYRGDLDGDTLELAIEWAVNEPRSPEAPLDLFSWPRISALTLDAFRRIVNGDHNRTESGRTNSAQLSCAGKE